ncbi:zinc-binding dehydrogenase [Rhodococcus sp. IEGM 1307]|jgi:propanol-preferring alcohol dehydrogenase|uniref:zinc-binding dehydrogenase n=1 Tax=Rhodococcus sp. IEGM 1307 TaxID=3047091 RepID=UPI0024B7DB74|nr:zinc-binding dehydrogenase [Rhodococcus sp. IEGM 1307]MDI9979497.1 zinc-binding dehydrogenase [Rhodococcus sp. IEGM 1307]
MRAWQFNSTEDGLEYVDVDPPIPGPGEVLIDVEAAGMCHSDVQIVNGHGDAWLRKRPIILGHEVAGTVRGLGGGVNDIAIGDRVAVALSAPPIERMDFVNGVGLGFDGGFAEQAVSSRVNIVAIPEGVPFTHAAVAIDSLATAYHAVVSEAGAGAASTLAIIGLGGLGLSAVQIAKARGATVYGVDIDSSVFDSAREQGAIDCFSDIREVPGSVDAVVDFAGMASTIAAAVTAVKLGGRVVVGSGHPEVTIDLQLLITNNVALRGSLGASIDDLEAVLDLLAKKELVPAIEEVSFAEIPDALERLEVGQVRGLLVARPRT